MAVTPTQVETQVEALVAAIDADDYAAARKAAAKIKVYMLALPDYGTGQTNVRYSRERIADLLDVCDRLEAEAEGTKGGMITHADFSDDDFGDA